jgi:hypothetical protein
MLLYATTLQTQQLHLLPIACTRRGSLVHTLAAAPLPSFCRPHSPVRAYHQGLPYATLPRLPPFGVLNSLPSVACQPRCVAFHRGGSEKCHQGLYRYPPALPSSTHHHPPLVVWEPKKTERRCRQRMGRISTTMRWVSLRSSVRTSACHLQDAQNVCMPPSRCTERLHVTFKMHRTSACNLQDAQNVCMQPSRCTEWRAVLPTA